MCLAVLCRYASLDSNNGVSPYSQLYCLGGNFFKIFTVVRCGLPRTPRCHKKQHPARYKMACVGNNFITKTTHNLPIIHHRARDVIFRALSPFYVRYATESWGGAWE